jgi:CheY-like chemotaxis protein
VASELDIGSTFAFFIKTRHAEDPMSTSVINSNVSPEQNNNQTKQRQKSDINILIVEDNAVNQKVLRQQLSKQGYTVAVADNGLDCLSHLQNTKHWRASASDPSHSSTSSTTSDPSTSSLSTISVILMDIEMPKMDGLTATREIRTWEHQGKISNHIPIIAVSANARQEQRELALGAGMDDSVAKPFRIAELVPKIERLVGWS